MQNLVFVVVFGAMLFFAIVFVIALVAGLGWKWGRGQVVVAYYEINPDFELAKVRMNTKTGVMQMKRLPQCATCAEDKRMSDLHEQLNDPEEQL